MGILSSFNKLIKSHSARMIWYRVAIVISSLAIFVTTYLLMLPASTTTGATEITQLGNGIQKAITYDKDGKLKINVNNIFRIDAYLGYESASDGDYNDRCYISSTLNNSANNTVLVRLRDNEGNWWANLGEYLFSDYNQTGADSNLGNFPPNAFWNYYLRNGCGTSDVHYQSATVNSNVDFSQWIAIRVECYKASQFDSSLRGGNSAYEYYSVQQVYGTVDKPTDKNYNTDRTHDDFTRDMISKLFMGTTTEKGFILLVRKSFVDNPSSLYSKIESMYIPQVGSDADKYEPGKDCLVDFNQEPLAFQLPYADDNRMHEGIYSTKAENQPIVKGVSTNRESDCGLGFITFSLWQEQLNVKNAPAMDSDKDVVKEIDFKLFDYNEYINMSQTGKNVTNSSDQGYIRKIAPFFSFRNNANRYNDYEKNLHKPQIFWWNDYSPCNCTDIFNGNSINSCHHSQYEDSGSPSYLHNPVYVAPGKEESTNDRRYDWEAFLKYHTTVKYNLNDDEFPELDFTRDANYNPITEYYLSNTAKATYFYPSITQAHIENALPSNDYNLSAQDRSLAYLFGGVGDHAVTTYDPANSILQYDEDHGRYYYDSADNAVDYDPQTNLFRVRDYVESGYYGALESNQTFDFFPFNYSNGYVTGTKCVNKDGKWVVREKSYEDSAILEDATSEVWNDTDGSTIRYNNINYWFGMSMEFDFLQSKDGKLVLKNEDGSLRPGHGDSMIFEFSGDDDVWVFVDGVLVLDLGGTHAIVNGKVDFSTGEIIQTGYNGGRLFETTLIECFGRAGKLKFGGETKFYNAETKTFDYNGFVASNEVPDGWKKVVDGNGEQHFILADYSKHNLKFFYLERAAHVANNSISFAMPAYSKNSLIIETEVIADEEALKDDLNIIQATQDYAFRVVYTDEHGNFLTDGNGNYELVYDNGAEFKLRTFEADGSFYDISGVVGPDGIIKLKHGQQAIFEDIFVYTNPGATNEGERLTKHFRVQEILPADQFYKYDNITSTHLKNEGQDVTDGSVNLSHVIDETSHTYTMQKTFVNRESNHIKITNPIAKTHKLEIFKVLKDYDNTNDYGGDITIDKIFNVAVTADGKNLPVGAKYEVYDQEGNLIDSKEVKELVVPNGETSITYSVVEIKHNQKVVIKGFLESMKFTVKEIFENVSVGYTVSYSFSTSDNFSGTIEENQSTIEGEFVSEDMNTATASVTISNNKNGISTSVPVTKVLKFANKLNTSITFKFNLEQIVAAEPNAALSNTKYNNGSVDVEYTSGSKLTNDVVDTKEFQLKIPDNFAIGEDSYLYYRITEVKDNNSLSLLRYDESVYILTLVVNKTSEGTLSFKSKTLTKYDNASDTTGDVISTVTGIDPIKSAEFVNLVYYTLPSTGANLYVHTNMSLISILGAVMVLGALVAVVVCVKKCKKTNV